MVSWQTLNVVDTTSATPDLKIRAVAGQFQWQFDYMPDATPRSRTRTGTSPRRRTRCSASSSRPASTAGWSSPPGGPSSSTSPATTSSTPSTSRSSCSSATSSRAGSTSSTSRSTTRMPTRRSAASARSCAAPGTRSCCSTSTPCPGPTSTSGSPSRRPRSRRHSAAPSASGGTGGPAGPPVTVDIVAQNIDVTTTAVDGPGQRAVHDPVRQPGRGTAAQRQDLRGSDRRQGRLRRQGLPGVGDRGLRGRAAPGRHATRSSASSTQTMTGTLTVQ